MPKYQSYRTRRLELRPWRLSDFRAWVESSETAWPKQDKFDMPPVPLEKRTYETFKRNVLRQRREAKQDEGYLWNIFVRATGEFVGWIDIGTVARKTHQMANFGYFVINRHRGKGYATEAVKRLVKAGHEDLKFQRLEAVTDLDNRASIALARAAGFHKEGVKKHYWFQNGRWEDQMVLVSTPELLKRRRAKP